MNPTVFALQRARSSNRDHQQLACAVCKCNGPRVARAGPRRCQCAAAPGQLHAPRTRPFGRAHGGPGGSFGRILGLPDRGEPLSSRHTRADSGGRFALAHAHAFPAQVHARLPAPHWDAISAAATRRRRSNGPIAVPENMNGRPGQLAQCHSLQRAGKLQAAEGPAGNYRFGSTVTSLVSGCCQYRTRSFMV